MTETSTVKIEIEVPPLPEGCNAVRVGRLKRGNMSLRPTGGWAIANSESIDSNWLIAYRKWSMNDLKPGDNVRLKNGAKMVFLTDARDALPDREIPFPLVFAYSDLSSLVFYSEAGVREWSSYEKGVDNRTCDIVGPWEEK